MPLLATLPTGAPLARPLEVGPYLLRSIVSESGRSIVYRGEHRTTHELVVVKTLRDPHPTSRQIASYERAFELGRAAASPGLVRDVELVHWESSVALVMEDVGGVSLDRAANGEALPVADVLRLGAALAGALGGLHAAGVIHKDIKPANVVIRPGTSSVWLIDLGIATRLARESVSQATPNRVEGTLLYVSPEQTGRTNRSVDSRSDLYSLGATLFELAAGRPPFVSLEPVELLHAHLAHRPPVLSELRPEIPKPLSDIVATLLEKSVDARYASAFGVQHDLSVCLAEWEAKGGCAPFTLRSHDRSPVFRVPEKLYGRESEVAQLMEAFGRASRGEVVLLTVSGYAGIGKTALVGEVRQPIAEQRGYFCAGKFDQFRRDLPYVALLGALSDLVRQVLTEPSERIERYRADVLEAVENLGGVLTAVLPDLVHLIGEQPPVPDAGPIEAQLRMKRLFSNFVKVFARSEHPVTFFLDDLQWADAPSLALLEALASDRSIKHLLLIGGFRDNEVGAAHPLRSSLERIGSGGCAVMDVTLGPIAREHVVAIVAAALDSTLDHAAPLGHLVHERTAGNPFFVLELIRDLHDGGVIRFDSPTRSWSWDEAALRGVAITGNVVDLLTRKLGELPAEALDTIQTAACCGAEFDLATLVMASGRVGPDVARALAPALAAGLVIPLDADYRLAESSTLWEAEGGFDVRYRFQHDRVQQAAHGFLAEDELEARHLRIGRVLLDHCPEGERRHRIIDIVNHLDLGLTRLETDAERTELASLNLEAARTANASLAFDAARHYLDVGRSLLPENPWGAATIDLALGLYEHSADNAMARGDMASLDAFGALVIEHARTPLERLPIYRHKLRADVIRTRYAEAVDLALDILKGAGVVLPRKPHTGHVLAEIAKTWIAMRGRRPLELASLPDMERAEDRALIAVLTSAAPAAYFAEPNLLPIIGTTSARLSMRLGNAGPSAYGYAVCGLILCGVLGDIDRGYEFGQLAERLGERYGGADQGRAEFVVVVFIRHWKEPLKAVAKRLHDVWRRALLNGDEESATYCAGVSHYNGFFSGESLDVLVPRLADPVEQMASSGQEHSKYGFLSWAQLFALFRSASVPTALSGAIFDMKKRLPQFEATKNGVQIALSSLASGILHLTFGRHREAWIDLERAHEHRESIVAQVAVPGLAYVRAIAGLSLLLTPDGAAGASHLRREVRADRDRLAKWVTFFGGNFGHRLQLVDALRFLLSGDLAGALVALERAIESARAAAMPYDEALGCEHAARVCSRLGLPQLERSYYTRSARLYVRWGAIGKALTVDDEARRALGTVAREATAPTASVSVSSDPDESRSTTGAAVDVSSLLKALRTISREISVERLLSRTMEVALENAGADRGVLLLPSGGAWMVRLERRVGDAPGTGTTNVPLAQYEELPHAIVDFVARTRETVALDDATRADRFARDPYVLRARPRSVLCGPILRQGGLSAIVYLENRLSDGTFTEGRMQLVEAVGAQAAIAMENAGLYANLEGSLAKQVELTDAQKRFVPQEFLAALGKESIATVVLGDSVQKEMSILFSDMRGFTSLVEGMSPRENIDFINEYLAEMEPAILSRGGFVDSYLGDAIMALFPGAARDALAGAIEMLRRLAAYNTRRTKRGGTAVRIGVGVNTGMLTLGTIGGPQRIKCGVIGDPVNLASRIETATKRYGVPLLCGERTIESVASPGAFLVREVDRVRVQGRVTPTTLYEVFDADPEPLREKKLAIAATWSEALEAYRRGDLGEATAAFDAVRKVLPDDPVATLRHARAVRRAAEPRRGPWDHVEELTEK